MSIPVVGKWGWEGYDLNLSMSRILFNFSYGIYRIYDIFTIKINWKCINIVPNIQKILIPILETNQTHTILISMYYEYLLKLNFPLL